MRFSKKLVPAVAVATLSVATPALAEDLSFQGKIQCDLATGYILQKVNVEIRDQAQITCAGSITTDTPYGVWSVKTWNTTDIDGGFSAETDLGIAFKPSKDSPLTLGIDHYFISGESNDIDHYLVDYNLGNMGGITFEALDRASGKTGLVGSYHFPKFKHRTPLGGALVHGPTISYAKRAGSGDDLVSLRYNAQWKKPISDQVAFVIRGQLAKPVHTTGAINSEVISQLNVGVAKTF